MRALEITAVAIPPAFDGGTSDGGRGLAAAGTGSFGDFRECYALREAHELEKWGNLDRCPTEPESVEYWRGSEYEERVLFLARVGQKTVGTCSVTLPLRENTGTAGIDVLVAPHQRRQGWGRSLLEHAEAVARGRGRTSLDAYCELPVEQVEGAGRLLPAKSGAGGLPAEAAVVAFAASAGYELEQVERSSRLSLPVSPEHLAALETEASARAKEYMLVGWADTCPEEFLTEYAVLKRRMSTDVPVAGMDWEAEDWDQGRVRQEEQTLTRSGVQTVVTAAMHRTTGELVAYTVLNWRAGVPAAITQQDTLVSAAHRGRRLGTLIKVANLRAAQQRWPAARSVLTWNASENQHMLAINISLGFKPAGYEGEWQKRLG
ncbi:GNAT family N-acetyltransferase [Arthrobacter sp. ISL-48]|uniref:GNAT family N-acetyltransferase n=1 Tax=Arthrobacter sp. ISL-48 TaxID=2819110 RepID=UPI001BEB067C|nr:GNAT family N-acetyltransferase [Arthrobacter sp. ISL-48]MBT2532140.1 GNAT family N-acetyltransferase [Arthrobacter sp. ISL-48]